MPKNKKENISSELLNDLYLEQNLSTLKISKICGVSQRTIHIRLKECDITLRPPGPNVVIISKKELRNLYLKQKLSSRKIAKIYNCAYSTIDRRIRNYGFPIKTLSQAHITTKRNPFSGNIHEKAYLLGFRIGDLRVRKMHKNSETILVDCASTKSAQIKLIKNLFSSYGRIWLSKPYKSGKIHIECSVDMSFSFLLPKYDKFPEEMVWNKKIFNHLLAGFADAEGSFYVNSNKKASGFSIGNYNKLILLQISDYFKQLNYTSRLSLGVRKGYKGKDGYEHRQDYWILSLYRKIDVYRFANFILPYLRHKAKIANARKVLKNISTRNEKYGYIGMIKPKMINFNHEKGQILSNHSNSIR